MHLPIGCTVRINLNKTVCQSFLKKLAIIGLGQFDFEIICFNKLLSRVYVAYYPDSKIKLDLAYCQRCLSLVMFLFGFIVP